MYLRPDCGDGRDYDLTVVTSSIRSDLDDPDIVGDVRLTSTNPGCSEERIEWATNLATSVTIGITGPLQGTEVLQPVPGGYELVVSWVPFNLPEALFNEVNNTFTEVDRAIQPVRDELDACFAPGGPCAPVNDALDAVDACLAPDGLCSSLAGMVPVAGPPWNPPGAAGRCSDCGQGEPAPSGEGAP